MPLEAPAVSEDEFLADIGSGTLFIFPPSSGCETINWQMKLYGATPRVDCRTVPFFLFAIRKAGGSTYPFLKLRDQGFETSRTISMELESRAPPALSLMPVDSEHRDDATRLWTEFVNPKLGDAAPRWAYFWLLPHKRLLFGPLTRNTAWWQRLVLFVFYSKITQLMRKALKIRPEEPKDAVDIIREVFDEIDKRLADGRPYLFGERPCLVDYGFAAMAAPAVLEPNYGGGGLLPSLEDAPSGMRGVVEELRSRPAGALIRRMYAEHR